MLAACASAGQTLGYKRATSAREKAASVLAKAEEPYGHHADAVLDLINEVDAGYSQAQSHSNNRASKQWLQVKDELQKFAADWHQREALSGPYLQQRVKIILGHLDAIIADEAAKKAP